MKAAVIECARDDLPPYLDRPGQSLCTSSLCQSPYDIVILNGRVMDPETNFDGIRNVGIKDRRVMF